ncbi:MAG TPA: pseudouridine synthase, partial [Parvularculaceae bacterium]|nr:pseudouridine synthase [Parvularculaceae bacterium]
VDAPLARAGGDRKKMAVVDEDDARPDQRRAVTHYRLVEAYGRGRAKLAGDALAALIECRLETGRTHQIRVHMASIGCPLIGDPVYGRGPGLSGLKPGDAAADTAIAAIKGFHRQALHARILGFNHPISGKALRFASPAPEDFRTLADALRAL